MKLITFLILFVTTIAHAQGLTKSTSPYDSEWLSELPVSSVLTFHVSATIPAGTTYTAVGSVTGWMNGCVLKFDVSAQERVINSQLIFTTNALPQPLNTTVGNLGYTPGYMITGDVLIDSSPAKNVGVYCFGDLWKIGEFRSDFEKAGGTLIIPAPLPFGTKN